MKLMRIIFYMNKKYHGKILDPILFISKLQAVITQIIDDLIGKGVIYIGMQGIFHHYAYFFITGGLYLLVYHLHYYYFFIYQLILNIILFFSQVLFGV